jgi:hypothetical protein
LTAHVIAISLQCTNITALHTYGSPQSAPLTVPKEKQAQTQPALTPHSPKTRQAADRRWNAAGELVIRQTQKPA